MVRTWNHRGSKSLGPKLLPLDHHLDGYYLMFLINHGVSFSCLKPETNYVHYYKRTKTVPYKTHFIDCYNSGMKLLSFSGKLNKFIIKGKIIFSKEFIRLCKIIDWEQIGEYIFFNTVKWLCFF